MTIHALDKNFLVQSIPVTYRDRPEGSTSKLNTYADGLRVLRTIFRLYKDYRPFRFFGALAIVFLLIALGLFIPVLVEFVRTGLVLRMPTLVTAVFFGLAAIQSFTCGLILDTQGKKSRQNFEIQLNLMQMLHQSRAEQQEQSE